MLDLQMWIEKTPIDNPHLLSLDPYFEHVLQTSDFFDWPFPYLCE